MATEFLPSEKPRGPHDSITREALPIKGSFLMVSVAVTCSPTELAPCASAITTSSPPSKLCCRKINQQKPCLCQYLKNPNLKKFVSSPNARKVSRTCGVPFPNLTIFVLTPLDMNRVSVGKKQ
ncbi:hypothetical protein LguiB_022589 [Lonicera macranthoides]